MAGPYEVPKWLTDLLAWLLTSTELLARSPSEQPEAIVAIERGKFLVL